MFPSSWRHISVLGVLVLIFQLALVAQTPSITGISPNPAPINTSVTISGTNFGSSTGTVRFNGTTATITGWINTSITATVPSGATSGDVVVTTSGLVPSAGFSFTVAPKITGLSPNAGPISNAVTISGTTFGATTGTVTFSGTTAATSSWTDTGISTTVPSGATTGNVVVTTSGGLSSAGVSFTVQPKITAANPSSGTPGTPVTLTGTGFGAAPGIVQFGSAQATTSNWSTTSIDTIVPAGAGSNSVSVQASGLWSQPFSFTIPQGIVTDFFPFSGRYGTSITITGSNFGTINSPPQVKFNGTPATAASTWTNTTIVVGVPTGATSGFISVNGGFSSQQFNVIPPPAISQLSPNTGPVNTVVAVTGVGFGSPQGTSTITFNGVSAIPTSWNNTTIIVTVPQGATTGNVVITAGGQVSSGVPFTVTSTPSVTTLTPNTGAAGTSVTIAGSNFGSSQGTSVVRFNGVAADVNTWSNTSISAIAPQGVSTGPVTVTVSGQTSNGITFTAVTAGTLSGSVTRSSDGTGVSGALIEALQNSAIKFSTTAASNGTYSISSVTGGTYDLRISAATLGTAIKNSVLIPAGQTTTQNFTLSNAGTISGRVTQADGTTPISGATVQVYVGSAPGSSVTSDASGNYSIGTLNADTYSVQASAAGFVSKTRNSVAVTGGGNTTADFALFTPGNGPISYVYDELGRLIAVSDATGDTAIYSYDAVGNILSIARRNTSVASVISFTPGSGIVGSTVTISGTGFSTTPSQNTVQFNGTTATVSSSTATQIVATVPTGATTGTISVTSPAGLATSAASFTVLADAGVPTITSFTPDRGVAGAAVTVSGTNFDTVPVNDNLRLNLTAQLITSATATSLSTTVPAGTGSGKLSLVTPKGKATSTQDFYVPFGTHVASDIAYTVRIDFGQTQAVTLPTGKIGLLIFDGVQNQKVFVRFTGSTLPACTLKVYDPYNRQLGGGVSCASGSPNGFYLDNVNLPVSGSYVIGIDPSSFGGSISVSVSDITDAVGFINPIPVSGDGGAVTNTVPGKATRLYFTGYAGQRLSVKINTSTYTSAGSFTAAANVAIASIDGNFILSPSQVAAGTFIDPDNYSNGLMLPTAGTYYVLIDPLADSVGTLNLSIFDVPPPAQKTFSVGIADSIAVDTPGQHGLPIVTLGEGAHISITYTYSGSSCSLKLFSPTGATVVSLTACNPIGFLEVPYPLSAGDYLLWLKGTLGSTGTFNVTVNDATDASYNITPVATGTSVTVTNTVPGQNGKVTFTGATGYRTSVYVNSTNYTQGMTASLNISGPSGAILTGASAIATNFFDPDNVTGLNLSANGTYSLLLDPPSNATGNAVLTIHYFQDVTGSVTIGGSALSVQTVGAGQNAYVTFAGTSGQQVTVHLTGNTLTTSAPTVALLRQNGSILTSTSSTQASFNLATQTLPATETYTIKINPQARTTGTMNVSVTTP